MSNVIKFPGSGEREAHERSHVGRAFLAEPDAHTHVVQFYEDETFLFETVGRFLAAGLLAGERLLVIAEKHHGDAFRHRLVGLDAQGAIDGGRLLFADANETLAKLMVDGMPDAARFRDVLARLLASLGGDGEDPAPVRAYGEMVDVLWREGNAKAALRLEELWNDARNEHQFSLLCAYSMGHFYKEGDAGHFQDVCRSHTHVMPAESFAQLDESHAQLREIAVLQQRARSLEHEIQHRKDLERALRAAVEDGRRSEDALRASLKREKEARANAEASDAFKEVFLGMLGHDLRNPLNTVLTTARLMAIRGELPAESQKRVCRIISSGERMQRMIEQILDVTRARLASGITVEPLPQNVVPIVARIVDEIAAAHPHRVIDLLTDGPCSANVDADRFEQVVSNLLSNAVVHGDPGTTIRVEISTRETVISVAVHNHGVPIPPSVVPLLFNPFAREKPESRSHGLGLGLYISERIVDAHGGTIEVESSAAGGTRFDVMLPRR